MTTKAYTLEEVLALRAASKQAVEALMPLRNQHEWPAPEYTAMNRIINAAVDLSDQADNAYVDAHIIPAPANPAPAFTAKLAAVKADLEDPAHITWGDFDFGPAILTGRTYVSINGATWYEMAAIDELDGPAWVSSDVDADPRGWSSKWEHVAHDVRGAIL